MQELKALYAEIEAQLKEDYFALLRFPSISADPEHMPDLRSCADWVHRYLKKSGFECELWETSGPPAIFAQSLTADADKPTLLLYGHYDVQPVDPLEEWHSPPFEPHVDGKKVVARGAQDNKGQLIYTLAALRALRAQGDLPINVKVLVEGEEETKSTGLNEILPQVRDKLQADYFVSPDMGVPALDNIAVSIGLRGVVAMSVEVIGASSDLHSGLFGGVVYNPNHALVEMLAKLRGPDGKILVPGFYDAVQPLTAAEREQVWLDVDEEGCRRDFGAEPNGGEQAYPTAESGTIRPTLEINGLRGGYGGPGIKTVIPARAVAKLSCRLVPDQDPAVISKAIADYLRSLLPAGLEMVITEHGGAGAVRSSPQSVGAQTLAKAYEEVFNLPCRFIIGGASIPISAAVAATAGAEPAFCGLGLLSDDIHAPNEHFDFDRLELGFLIICRFLQLLGGNSHA